VRRNTRDSGANVETAQHNQSTLPQLNSEVVLSSETHRRAATGNTVEPGTTRAAAGPSPSERRPAKPPGRTSDVYHKGVPPDLYLVRKVLDDASLSFLHGIHVNIKYEPRSALRLSCESAQGADPPMIRTRCTNIWWSCLIKIKLMRSTTI
jgi:hypothetical protein